MSPDDEITMIVAKVTGSGRRGAGASAGRIRWVMFTMTWWRLGRRRLG